MQGNVAEACATLKVLRRHLSKTESKGVYRLEPVAAGPHLDEATPLWEPELVVWKESKEDKHFDHHTGIQLDAEGWQGLKR